MDFIPHSYKRLFLFIPDVTNVGVMHFSLDFLSRQHEENDLRYGSYSVLRIMLHWTPVDLIPCLGLVTTIFLTEQTVHPSPLAPCLLFIFFSNIFIYTLSHVDHTHTRLKVSQHVSQQVQQVDATYARHAVVRVVRSKHLLSHYIICTIYY